MQDHQRFIRVEKGTMLVDIDVTEFEDIKVERLVVFIHKLLTNLEIPRFKISDIREKF